MEASLSRLLVGLSVQISRSDGELDLFRYSNMWKLINTAVVGQRAT